MKSASRDNIIHLSPCESYGEMTKYCTHHHLSVLSSVGDIVGKSSVICLLFTMCNGANCAQYIMKRGQTGRI